MLNPHLAIHCRCIQSLKRVECVATLSNPAVMYSVRKLGPHKFYRSCFYAFVGINRSCFCNVTKIVFLNKNWVESEEEAQSLGKIINKVNHI